MTESLPDLGALLREFRGTWEIGYQESPAGWVAVSRPTPTRLHILAARDIGGLRAKIEAAQAAEH